MVYRYGIICIVSVFLLFPKAVSTDTVNLANDTILPLNDHLLPSEWKNMCSVEDETQNDVYFRCTVDSENSGKWRLDTLREWISTSNISYHFDVQCTDHSNVSLSWPIKAKNLVGIKITGCYIIDYYANQTVENFSPEVADQLITMQLVDNVILFNIPNVLYRLMNIENLSKDFICGHEDTIVVMIMRNVSYDFLGFMSLFEGDTANSSNSTLIDQILEAGEEFIKGIRKMKKICDYKQLKYVDYSIRSSRSEYDFYLMYSLYNEVRIFNSSHSGQTRINSKFKEWWIYFPRLEVLDLSYNNISTFDVDSMKYAWNTLALLHINLSHNNFTQITSEFIHLLVGIKNLKINLEGNPFHCACSPEMNKLVDLIQSSEIWKNDNYSRYEDIRHLKCASPETARGKSFISLTQNDMSCVMTSYAPIIILSSLIVLLIIIIIIIIRYRREIQILSYTRFHAILPCTLHERFQEKTYDAFVLYGVEDQVWVNKTFQAFENKERTKGCIFRFCLHQTDSIIGKSISDNIIESVEASRHTVIVLSKHFLKSLWYRNEFLEAFKQSFVERKRNLIVVLLEDVQEENLPEEVKIFTCIRKNDTIFHDRLTYALSSPKSVS